MTTLRYLNKSEHLDAGETNIMAETKLCACNACRLQAAGWDLAK